MLRAILLVIAVVVALAGVAGYVWLYPHVAPPPEPPEVIAARWADLEGWATAERPFTGDPAALRRALERLGGSGQRDFNPSRDRLRGADDLDDGARAALRELVAWGDGGGLGAAPCVGNFQPDPLPALRLFTLARVALASADDPDAPEVAAALRLGDALRSRGDLLQTLVGFAVADEARQIAADRSWPLGQAYAEHRPRAEQVFPALAREAYCAEATLEAALAGGEAPGDLRAGLAGLEREVAMLRWYEGRRIAALWPLRGDLRALVRAAQSPPERPKSLLVEVMVIAPSALDGIVEKIDAYDQWMARAE